MNTFESVDALVDELVTDRIDRRDFVQRAVALGLAASTAGLLADEASAQTSRTLRARLDAEPKNFDPAFFTGQHEGTVMAQIYEGLVGYDPGTFGLVNQLAQTFKVSTDGMRVDFTLRKGVQFHDGYGEVTAEDVKFSYERIAGLTTPPIKSAYAGDWEQLKEVRVIGKYSGRIILKAPFAPLLRLTLPLTSGYVVSRKAVLERGDKYATDPVGTGPYQMGSFTPAQRVVLTRFPRYAGKRPQWNVIELIPITQDQAAEIALTTGQIDFGILPIGSVDRFKKNSQFRVVGLSSLDYVWVAMNVRHPKLADINIRKAIRSAVDVSAILKTAYSGKAVRANSIIPKSMGVGYWPDAPRYNRDLAKARAFLREAGVSSLELDFFVPGYQAYGFDWKTAGQIVQANLADINVKANLQLLDVATFGSISVGDNLNTLQMSLNGFGSAPDPFSSFVWHTCQQVFQYNEMGWCNRQYSRLNDRATKITDEEARTRMYITMQKLMDRSAHSVWIAHPVRYFASKRQIVQVHRPDGREPQLKAFRT